MEGESDGPGVGSCDWVGGDVGIEDGIGLG